MFAPFINMGQSMKLILSILILISTTHAAIKAEYEGSRVEDVWTLIEENPYQNLPKEQINMKRLTKWGKNKLAQSASRTISDKSDILPYFEKLVHASGVCLLGTWEITEETLYSGYFKKGANAIIIGRASSALTHTEAGEKRSLGLAGKIFPTRDFYHAENLRTANFFTIDDLGGTKVNQFSKTALTNEPEVSLSLSSVFLIRMAAFVAKVFNKADENPNIRQLWQISSLGEKSESSVRTPMWMRLRAAPESKKLWALDFRDEFTKNIEENGVMTFNIEVAGDLEKAWDQPQNFKQIGQIKFTKDMASENCDHRLHFNHPKFRTDIR